MFIKENPEFSTDGRSEILFNTFDKFGDATVPIIIACVGDEKVVGHSTSSIEGIE